MTSLSNLNSLQCKKLTGASEINVNSTQSVDLIRYQSCMTGMVYCKFTVICITDLTNILAHCLGKPLTECTCFHPHQIFWRSCHQTLLTNVCCQNSSLTTGKNKLSLSTVHVYIHNKHSVLRRQSISRDTVQIEIFM